MFDRHLGRQLVDVVAAIQQRTHRGGLALDVECAQVEVGDHHGLRVDDAFGSDAVQREGEVARCADRRLAEVDRHRWAVRQPADIAGHHHVDHVSTARAWAQ